MSAETNPEGININHVHAVEWLGSQLTGIQLELIEPRAEVYYRIIEQGLEAPID